MIIATFFLGLSRARRAVLGTLGLLGGALSWATATEYSRALQGPSTPNILILNSYHLGYLWSDREMDGVLSSLTAEFPRVDTRIEFLDAKRNPQALQSPAFIEFLQQKHREHQFQAIITLDDPALDFVLTHREKLGRDVPVIFGGINHYTPARSRNDPNVTGVIEAFDFRGTLQLLFALRPEVARIHLIIDSSRETEFTRRAFQPVQAEYADRTQFVEVRDWSYPELLERLSQLPPDEAGLILGMARDSTGYVISPEDAFFRQLAMRSAIPLFLVSSPHALHGEHREDRAMVWYGVGGSMLAGYPHGQGVAALATRVLSGEPIASIPIMDATPTRRAVYHPQLVQHGLDPERVPRDFAIIGQPVSFYDLYRGRILGAIALLLSLAATILVLALNILRRKAAERALLESHERFNLVARATNDAVWDYNAGTGEWWWNDNFDRMMHLPSDTPRSRETWEHCFHPNDRDTLVNELFREHDAAARVHTAEYRFVRPDGTEGHALLRAYLIRDPSRTLVRAIGSMFDITERKRTEQELLRLATAVEQSTEIIVILDPQGRLEYCNPAFSRAIGVHAREAQGRLYDFFRDPQHATPPFERVAAMVRERGQWIDKMTARGGGREPVILQVSISCIRGFDEDISGYLMVARDLTMETRLEEQVRLSQKMEAIGTLAGGIAHDFNNLLQVITSNTSLALDESTSEADRLGHLQEISDASAKAAQLTHQLLVFARRQTPQVDIIDLQIAVRDMLKLLRRVIGADVQIQFHNQSRQPTIKADRNQIEQVLMNLCINARDAMEGGGTLSIKITERDLTPADCSAHTGVEPGRFICLEVSDTGHGMSPDVCARIFDPFFSTKPKGKGTGLGLSVVFGIVQNHGGLIDVESVVGSGTRFFVYFPAVLGMAQPTRRSDLPVLPRGDGTILLIEDDPAVHAISARILQMAGFHVLSAYNGAEGVELAGRHLTDIRAVVVDAIMPVMGGQEAYQRISRLKPELPFLFCSGYNTDNIKITDSDAARIRRLQKPYLPGDLLREIHQLIGPSKAN